MISLMPASLMFGTQLDLGQIASGLIGVLLLMSAFASIGLFISSLTSSPAIAAISTFGVLFLLWIINIAGTNASEGMAEVFAYMSLAQALHQFIDRRIQFNGCLVLYYCLRLFHHPEHLATGCGTDLWLI